MKILKSRIFEQFPEIIFGFSTKDGLNRGEPFFFNLSLTVGDDENIVQENTTAFINELGLNPGQVAFQLQIHSDKIQYVTHGGSKGESDALITDKINLGLAISAADCTNIYLYMPDKKIIAGIHAGWKGTQNKILPKTLNELRDNYSVKPEDVFAFIGPTISQKNYEVGKEVADYFKEKYLKPSGDKFLLDLPTANFDMLQNFGVPNNQIEISDQCTFENKELHSYRRDGIKSGRGWGIIAMKGDN